MCVLCDSCVCVCDSVHVSTRIRAGPNVLVCIDYNMKTFFGLVSR